MNTASLVTGPDRNAGALLGAAVGDALGWPQENRSKIVGGNAARHVEPTPRFREWVRTGGTRYASYQDPVRAGQYSDDTQLMMAVARACLHGPAWLGWLSAVELPQWPLYQRGGGGAVLRAARSWAKGQPPWAIESTKDTMAARRYFDAGGNGVAMRIAAHAALAAQNADPDQLPRRIIADGLTTHGHPHALIGAVLHGQALFHALSKNGTLEYGELLERLVDEPTWADPALLMDTAGPDWHDSYRLSSSSTRSNATHAAKVWDEAAREVLDSLTLSREALKRGALVNDHDTLEAIGCFDDRRSGAGTVAAIAAAYVASRSASRPMSGLLRTAFLHGADTDTIASMTGSILGALHGTGWLGPMGENVQDRSYLLELAARLTQTAQEPDRDAATGTEVEPVLVTESALRKFTSSLLSEGAQSERLPDGRPFHITERIALASTGRTYVTRLTVHAEDGQTLLIDRAARTPTETSARGPSTTQGELFEANKDQDALSRGQIQSARVTRVELRVSNLQASARFYGDLLGLRLQAHSGDIQLENGLILTEARTTPAPVTSNSTLVLSVTHPAPEQLAKRAEAEAQATWSTGNLWLKDPDGNSIRVVRATR